MEKLTIKELAPYLPYGLRVSSLHTLHARNGIGNISHVIKAVNEGKSQYKPILRPLSDMTKEIEHNGEKFVPSNEFKNLYLNDVKWGNNSIGTGIIGESGDMINLCFISNEIVGECPFDVYELLIQWHFDIFGLIEKGLAVDINKLNE